MRMDNSKRKWAVKTALKNDCTNHLAFKLEQSQTIDLAEKFPYAANQGTANQRTAEQGAEESGTDTAMSDADNFVFVRGYN